MANTTALSIAGINKTGPVDGVVGGSVDVDEHGPTGTAYLPCAALLFALIHNSSTFCVFSTCRCIRNLCVCVDRCVARECCAAGDPSRCPDSH